MHKGKARIRFHIQSTSRNPDEGFFSWGMGVGFKPQKVLKPQKALSLPRVFCAFVKVRLLWWNVESILRDNVRSM